MRTLTHVLSVMNRFARNCLIPAICSLFLASLATAEDFIVNNVGDFGNITVMEVSGNYDENKPDGATNALPRQLIAKEFFKTHKDEYDTLVIFTGFDFAMAEKKELAFYSHVKNDIRGIGMQIFDNSALYGSNGRLQGTIDMGNVAALGATALDSRFEATLDTLSHELLHRWSAHVRFKDTNGNLSTALLGLDGAHWSYLLDTKGSLQYGNHWQESGNGSFSSVSASKYFSPLDLYLMGMIDKSLVPPMLLIDNPAIDPTRLPEPGATITGTPRFVTIDDIIAAEGERIPGVRDAQKQFKMAFIYIITPGTVIDQELNDLENIRNGFLTRYSILTDGQGLVQVAATPREDLPANPGVKPITASPRSLPPNIDDGVTWLITRQQTDGSWTDIPLTAARDTAEVVTTLHRLATAQQQWQAGLAWLGSNPSATTDFLSRRIEVAVQGGGNKDSLVQELLDRRNPDGGWGSGRSFISNATDTALALKALARAGYGDREVVNRAVAYLQTSQNQDGGWSGDDRVSAIHPTAAVLTAFNAYRKSCSVDNSIARAIAFLTGKQNPDGGFGNSPSSVDDSAVTIMALQETGADRVITDRGITYLLAQQTDSGSWEESPHQTALAIRALWQATVDPDLSITADDIAIIPAKINALPCTVVLSAVIRNLGRTDVAQATVAVYDGAVSTGKKVTEQLVAFPGQSQVTVTFSLPVTDGKGHFFTVVVDPDNLVKEANKTNNSASRILVPEVTYDFEVLAANLAVTPNPATMFQDVSIQASIVNHGTSDAFSVPVRFFIDDPTTPVELADMTVDIPAGGSVARKITWNASKSGNDMPLTIMTDPLNVFTETNKANNRAVVPLTVSGSLLPNLMVSYRDMVITPSPANQGGNATISVLVKNGGFAPAANVTVHFYRGVPDHDGFLLGSRTIPAVNPGDSVAVSLDWLTIGETGGTVIYVRVDPDTSIHEITRVDNDAFTTLTINSLPDLAISSNSIVLTPDAPKEGDSVTIAVTVHNNGDQDAADVDVRISEGGTVIGAASIPLVKGHSQATVSLPCNATGQTGSHDITVMVDPGNRISETSKENNTAVKRFTVQNAKLWVSNPYFSPNGDGVKDTIDFAFRLDTPARVKLLVVNGTGGVVRMFNGGDLDNTAGTVVTWDGRGDAGTVVADGEYQFEVVDGGSEAVLGKLPVVLDTNRSVFGDAMHTKYMLINKLPDLYYNSGTTHWFNDENGFVLETSAVINGNSYATIGKVSTVDGSYANLLSDDLLINNSITDKAISSDSEKIALILRANFSGNYTQKIIVVDKDGAITNVIKETSDNNDNFSDIEWSPFGAWLQFREDYLDKVAGAWQTGIWLVNAEDTIRFKVTVSGTTQSAWSPDGKKLLIYSDTNAWIVDTASQTTTRLSSLPRDNEYSLAMAVWSPNSDKIACYMIAAGAFKVKIVAANGDSKDIFSGSGYLSNINNYNNSKSARLLWMPHEKLPLYVNNDLWLADASGTGNIQVYTSPGNSSGYYLDGVTLSPDSKFLVYSAKTPTSISVEATDSHGNKQVLYHELLDSLTHYTYIEYIYWSYDSTKIAYNKFSYNTDWSVQNNYAFHDIHAHTYLSKKAGGDPGGWYDWIDGWISDNKSLLVENMSLNSEVFFNFDSGEYTPFNLVPDGWITMISPKGTTLIASQSSYIPSYHSDYYSIGYISNLFVDFNLTKSRSSVVISGTAQDLHFEGYQLEYADVKTPASWNLIVPPSDAPVVNSVIATWIPPYEGTFFVRLTGWDQAGNRAFSKKRVSWGGDKQAIVGMYKDIDVISPMNADGVNDEVKLAFTVLLPAHLEFTVFTEKGAPVRTMIREYTGYTNDFIAWDGRDDAHNLVPDGIYTIRLLDYTFTVAVDNTPPTVSAAMGRYSFDDKRKLLYVDLGALAYDKNIKSWKMEYGEGANPREWQEYRAGSDILASKDDRGALVAPIRSTVIQRFYDREIAWLKGKRFRITAVDFAGNNVAVVTDMLEEKVILTTWEDTPIINSLGDVDADTTIPPWLPQLHVVKGFETVRSPAASIILQYWNGKKWLDAVHAPDVSSGVFNYTWDSSQVTAEKGYGIRVKLLDSLGAEHFSNVLVTSDMYSVYATCSNTDPVRARNALFETLRLLRLQIQSSNDEQYPTWTDYAVYDAAQGDIIPTGEFLPPTPTIQPGHTYMIRMIGTGVSGKMYESSTSYPAYCPITITLDIAYDEAKECGEIAPGMTTLQTRIDQQGGSVLATALSYYLKTAEEFQLLKTFDVTRQGLSNHTFASSELAEGTYPVKAVLSYLDLTHNGIKEAEASATLSVDRTLPVSRITYPAVNAQKVCPVKIHGPGDDWFGIPVKGAASDTVGLKKYELYYGSGITPQSWQPATAPAIGPLGLTRQDITGINLHNGEIGSWDIFGLTESTYSLKLKAVDVRGNVSCATTSFTLDKTVEIPSVTLDNTLISPNNDGIADEVTLTYRIGENATVDANVYNLPDTGELGTVPVRALVTGRPTLAGSDRVVWNGRNDAGLPAPDGRYGLAIYATDACGNANMRWLPVEVDTTRPTVAIRYPKSGDPLPPGNIVEVKGTAGDSNFQSYALEAGQGETPAAWATVATGYVPSTDVVLGVWNTFGLTGKWTLRLSAQDKAGNKNSTAVIVDLTDRKTLVKSMNITPKIFSPNSDTKRDSALIQCDLTDTCRVNIDMVDAGGVIVGSHAITTASAGGISSPWNGLNSAGVTVADGAYQARLTATLTANPSISQTESLTVIVDTTAPMVDFKLPADKSYLNIANLSITGTISDQNLQSYGVTLAGASGVILQDSWSQSRTNHLFGTARNIDEGEYIFAVEAKDFGENVTNVNRTFIVDRTPPKATLDTPKDGDYIGAGYTVIAITGALVEKYLDRYSLRFGSGAAPTSWQELAGGNTLPASAKLYTWNVGKDDGVADGLYTVSLYAKDKAGLEGEARVKVIVDNTPPALAFSTVHDGDYIRGPIDIAGDLTDPNLDKGVLELATGSCATAARWNPLKNFTSSVSGGVLASWKLLPTDGDYCLRLSAIDKSGNSASATVSVKVAAHPPDPPVLSGKIDGKTNALLNWPKNTEADLAGYNVFRDGQKLNGSLLTDSTHTDINLKDGTYSYTVKAVNFAGSESSASNAVKLTIDTTGPAARITTPLNGTRVNDLVSINGTAFSTDDFKEYRIFAGTGTSPSSWSLIRKSPLPLNDGNLAQWDTTLLPEGVYSLKLEAEDLTGNVTAHMVAITVDNTPPAAPALLSVTNSGADAALSWRANTEADLAGYLVYRNGQLANGAGVLTRSYKPYQITGTTYLDKALPDGKYSYYLVAMDQAGNGGESSNSLSITIDTRPPHATITDPANSRKFDRTILVKAESFDNDIAAIQFQYKKVQDVAWTNLGAPVTTMPYVSYFDPTTLGLPFGDYHLTAIAIDTGGKIDPAPASITVTHTDLTPPEIPADLTAVTNGAVVTISWNANREQDLAGYNIYRTSGTTKKKINATPVNQPRFQDANLGDGIYTYEITAIDTNANESGPSAAITARVYGPTVTQPFTPVSAAAVSVAGYGAEPDATVEIYSTVGTVQTAVGTVIADAQGSFTGDSINLAPGENGITARAKDGVGNISRMSATVVVVRSVPPSAPTGLIATGQDTTVNLSWNKNPETDVAGYYVYRDGARLNTLYDYSFTATASSSAAGHNPAFAADWDWSTSWMSGNSPGAFSPAWLELDLPFAPLLVSRVHLYWLAGYVGRDFEIQAWSGSSWITLRKVTGNALQHNEFDIMPSYPTGKIRIFITATNCVDDTHQVGVQTARILSYSVVSQPAYQEQLPDGGYSYKIAAVNNLGFEGDPSADIVADVGDRIPPAHPLGLAATASGTAVALTWIKNGEPDMAGYHVYRKSADGWVKLTRGPVSASDARFVDQPLLNGHYRYRVTAVDAAGNESLPSDEAAAEVALVIPAPRNFRAAPASGEKGIDLMWDPPADTIDGYAIYRSLKSGGPYENLSQASLHGNSFRDTGIIPGTTYFYVVTARDTAGNESARSNEVSGVLPDSTPPNRPIVSYPTAPGMPVTLFASLADIAGMAEPGSRVELSRNNRSAGSSMATPHDIITSMDLPVGASYPVYTPDNQQVAYYLNQALWLKVIATGEAIQLMTPSGDNVSTWYPPAISPDGSKIIFEYLVSGWRHRIAVHDRNTGTTTTVTNDVDPYEWSAIWFRDSKRVAFASYQNGSTSLRIKNIETGELRILAEANNLDYLAISPDNKKIAYYEYPANGTWSLVVKDLESGGTLVTIDDTDGYLADWSPDNRRIAYMSGTGELHTIDIDTQEVRQLTASGSYKWSPTWSPDGKYIALAEYVQDRPYVLWIVDLNGNSRLIRDDLANISYLSWSSTGDLLCSTGTVSLSVTAAGTFKVKGVVLESGDNVITATAVDDSGRASLPSDAITVVLDTKLMPDTGIGGGDLTIYPAVPKTGEMVTVTAVVRNFSTIAVDNLPVVMYHWDAAGQLHLLKTEIVPHLTSQGSVEIYATIPAIPMTGNHSLIVMVDPENTINEILETNNSAIVGFTVTDREEVTLSTSLEALQYGANMNVSMHLAVRNSGSPAKGTLAVTVDDAAGTSAASIQRKAIIIPYGITEYRHDWNTGAFLAGSYQFHAVFTDDTGAVVESSTPFTILPDIRLDAHVITDKLDYGANEQVNLTLRITNKGSNYIAPHLTARLKIVDAGNTVLFADEKILENVLPAMVSSFSSRWKTGLSVPGTYDVIAEVYLDYKLVSSSSARFTITPVAHVNGAVAVNPAAVSFGSSFKAVYTVANSGNVLANGFIRAVIVDPETNSIITSTDQSTTIPVNGSLSGEFNFSSTGMRLHTYQMNAQFISKDGQKSIGSAGFTIKDVIPPNINVVSPIAGTTYYATISFTVRASDDASGLEAVEYQLDGGVWKPLPLEDPVNGRYAVAWNPSGTENGAHGVRFRATDKAGNSITSVSFPFTFQSVSKNPQTIAIFPMSATYGDADFAPGASASSGLPITYASGNPLVATVTANGLIHVVGTGSTTITATQEGNGSYLAAAAQQILTVAPALLTVTANNASRAIDAREPTFTASYSGFVKGETTAVLTGSPTFSTTAVATSPAGIYPITIGAGTLTSYNYRFRFVNGQLTISHSNSSVVDPTPADKTNQSISFAPLPSPVVHGCAPFTLSANATSGLEVTFSSSNGAVATISGATVTIKGVGTAIITASQSGNSNYNAAPDVTQTLTVLRDSTVPDLIVSTLSSGSLSGRPVVNVAGSASDPIGIAQVTVNGWPTPLDGDGGFSFPVFMTTGLNAITASADDNDGNRTTITRTITLDAAAPLLNLTSPADNSVTATADVTLSGNVGSSSIVVTYSLNGGESRAVTMSGVTFSANLTLEPGINTIEVTAVDLAGNKSSVKRTIILGKAFSLYLTDPDADLRTGRTSYLLKGKVANTTSPVTVTVTMDGITHTPPLIDGLFSQEIELGEERIYQVTVKAHDDNGSTVSVTRNFIYAQLGDSEGDGSLTIADALVAYLIRLGQRSATPADLTRLDVAPLESDGTPAGNGVIDVADVILILRHIVGLAPW